MGFFIYGTVIPLGVAVFFLREKIICATCNILLYICSVSDPLVMGM